VADHNRGPWLPNSQNLSLFDASQPLALQFPLVELNQGGERQFLRMACQAGL
jgi:hypothetical protein